jgi:ABC-2 type transport system permease protein
MTSTTMSGVRSYQRLTLTNTFTKALADRALLVLIAGLSMGIFNVMMGPMFLALEDAIEEMLEAMPESIMAIAGGADMATASGFYTGEMYSIMVPFAVIFVAVASAARAFGGEVENQTIGLVAASPIRRTRLAVDKVAAMVIHVFVAAAIMGLGVWIGAAIAELDISTANIVAITFMVSLLACAAGGLAMVISIISGRGTMAILVAMLVAVFAYAWSSFVPMADAIADWAWLSPWHQYIGTDPLGSGIDWPSAALLLILAIVPLVIGVHLFRRRDIPA